jgi:hypothetical protein
VVFYLYQIKLKGEFTVLTLLPKYDIIEPESTIHTLAFEEQYMKSFSKLIVLFVMTVSFLGGCTGLATQGYSYRESSFTSYGYQPGPRQLTHSYTLNGRTWVYNEQGKLLSNGPQQFQSGYGSTYVPVPNDPHAGAIVSFDRSVVNYYGAPYTSYGPPLRIEGTYQSTNAAIIGTVGGNSPNVYYNNYNYNNRH